jgi:hypothetical protein
MYLFLISSGIQETSQILRMLMALRQEIHRQIFVNGF